MIPKIIHYVWFSNSEDADYPEYVKKCIDSWKTHLPDYEIKLWNEKNVDLSACEYAKEAYDLGKFAFASDYVRLWVLYNYGGIYLDSDIEVLKSFDDLLDNNAFTGFEDVDRISAWIFGSEKGNPLFKELIDDYKNRKFVIGKGLYDRTPNPVPITSCLERHGLLLNGKLQKLGNITVYPLDYFCPFNPYRKDNKDLFSENTYCNHYFSDSWGKYKTEDEIKYLESKERLTKVFGKKIGDKIIRHYSIICHIGILCWGKYCFRKLIEKCKEKQSV